MYKFLQIILAIILVISCSVVIFKGFDKSEIIECKEWNQDATKYSQYYVVQWQVDQCKAHGIELVAPLMEK